MNEIVIANGMSVPTKQEIADKVIEITSGVNDGNIDPLRAYGLLSALEKMAVEAKKKIAVAAMAEREKYPKNEKIFGVDFTIAECGVKYDYSEDEEWCMFQENMNAIRTEQKARELILRETGRCSKTSNTTLKVTH